MSAWGNTANEFDLRRNLSYNAAGGAPDAIHRTQSIDANSNDQFPVLGTAHSLAHSNINNGSTLQQQLHPQIQLSQQQQQPSSLLSNNINEFPETLNQQISNSQAVLNAIKQTNGNVTNPSATVLPPGLLTTGTQPPSGESKDLKTASEPLSGPPTSTTTTSKDTSPNNDTTDELLDDMDKYGLKGLQPLLKMENMDLATIATGIDLSMLGLDLSFESNNLKISKTFASPWLETSRSEVEPLYTLPPSFHIKSDTMPCVETRINTFNDETLFFIFYSKPKDVLQELVARELNNRNWRYHKDLQVWLTKDSTVEPIPNGPDSEHGTYIFFDPTSWEYVTKEFVLYYQSII